VIERSGSGLETEYQVKPRKNNTPLSDDPDLVEKWMGAAKDLSFVEVSDDPEEDKKIAGNHSIYVLPYDRVDKEFLDNLEEDAAEEEEDEELPVVKKAKSAVATSKHKEPVEEAEEEDSEEDEVEKTVTARRAARRSFRR
jgi:hypothetical protein